MRVSAQAKRLYSQPTQAHNPVRRGSPLNYHSVFNCERKDSCSQKHPVFIHLHTCNITVSEPHSSNSSVNELHTRSITVSEPHSSNVNFSEPRTHSITMSEPHSDKSSVREPHTRNVNSSEPHTYRTTVREPHSVSQV